MNIMDMAGIFPHDRFADGENTIPVAKTPFLHPVDSMKK